MPAERRVQVRFTWVCDSFFMLISLTLLFLSADPQGASLPGPVRSALSSRWPQAKVVKVETEKPGQLEIELTSPEGTFEVTFSSNGQLLGEERAIELAAAPAPVQKTVGSWAGWKVLRIERVTEGKVITFEILAQPQQGAPQEIVLAADGKELKRAKATELPGNED